MPFFCDIILRGDATPEQLKAIGAALWHWCSGPGPHAGPYRSLNDQTLADLIDGKFPALSQPRRAEPQEVRLRVWDEASQDRRTTIAKLRRELPAAAVDDVVIDGISWNCIATGSNPVLDLTPWPG